jgi:glycosyltransferase involved in cell wall biosynthesis
MDPPPVLIAPSGRGATAQTPVAAPPHVCGQASTTRRLRIALVTETFPPEVNGVAMTIGRMLEGLLVRGHHVQLARPRQRRGEVARTGPQLEELLVTGVPLPRYQGLRMGLPAGRPLAHAWRRWRPDLVHVVTEGPLGWSALAQARRMGLPSTTDFHTNFHSYSAHYGVGFLKHVIGGYLRLFHNRALCTFVPTRQLREQLQSEGYLGLEVVARGVDTRLFNPERRSPLLRRQWGVEDGDPVVAYVGRIAPEKNLPLVLSAFSAMRQRMPRARLVLVGDGPERARVQRLHPEHVFAGMRIHEDLACHYASADVFLFPSLTETFGNVTVEAMASGLAVVAFDYAAAREHVVQGESGVLAPVGDGSAFERAAASLVADAARIRNLGRNARLSAERIDWDQVNDAFAAALGRYAGRRA